MDCFSTWAGVLFWISLGFIIPGVTLQKWPLPGLGPHVSRHNTFNFANLLNTSYSEIPVAEFGKYPPKRTASNPFLVEYDLLSRHFKMDIIILMMFILLPVAFSANSIVTLKNFTESSKDHVRSITLKYQQWEQHDSKSSVALVSKNELDHVPIHLETHRTKNSVNLRSPYDAQTHSEEYIPGLILPAHFYQFRLTQLPPIVEAYIIVRYPDHYNAALPQATINRIDRMSNEEFLHHILNEMSLDEREVLLFDETQRRRTFILKWPHADALEGDRMAASGFYYLGDGDRVQCAFCRGILQGWSPNDDPRTEHSRHFRFCRLVRNMDCGNIVYKPDRDLSISDLDSLKVTRFDIDGPSSMFHSSFNPEELGINLNKPFRSELAPAHIRKGTFKNAPKTLPFDIDDAVKAGFHYTGFDDSLRCFFCNGGLREWSTTDIPEVEHARWFPECPYLIALKGKDWVDITFDSTPPNKRNNKFAEVKEIEQKVKQRKTNQKEVMESYIDYLGYRKQLREKVWLEAGPFETVRPWLENIYAALDDKPLNESKRHDKAKVSLTDRKINQRNNPSTSLDVVDRASFHSSSFQSLSSYDGFTGKVETVDDKNSEMVCRNPECPGQVRESSPVRYKANFISLPCGHITFCEHCAWASEKNKRPVVAKCPRKECQSQIKAMIRFFTA